MQKSQFTIIIIITLSTYSYIVVIITTRPDVHVMLFQ